ncbi:MAG: hypothetical protein M1817_000636 [Caeruleum heppii]|nr:MAG: hypothetical protein M1817_000636 [Caeruleum heppii]
MSKNLLITGATGKQGGVVLDAVQRLPNASDFTILAVTRSPSSGRATALTKKYSNVRLVEGDLDDCPAIFAKANTPIDGVFSVQVPFGGKASAESEERQGKALVDAAIANDVKHFVYSSADRGGPNSITDPTNVPHFISKHNLEKHIEAKAPSSSMTYTILRPVAFMENFSRDIMGKLFVAFWRSSLSPTTKLQLVSTADIGWFAAQAFAHPEDPQWRNVAVSLAGDVLTLGEMEATFKKITGSPPPATFQLFGKAVLWMVGDMGAMFKWFEHGHGFGADIEALRKQNPAMTTLEDWLKKPENGFVKG